jgi:hypothetical protein
MPSPIHLCQVLPLICQFLLFCEDLVWGPGWALLSSWDRVLSVWEGQGLNSVAALSADQVYQSSWAGSSHPSRKVWGWVCQSEVQQTFQIILMHAMLWGKLIIGQWPPKASQRDCPLFPNYNSAVSELRFCISSKMNSLNFLSSLL